MIGSHRRAPAITIMPNNFDWQTEDELRQSQQALWDDPPAPPPNKRPRYRIPWRLVGIVTVLLAAVGAVVWWRIQARIDATMQALRNDVASSFNLVQLSAAEKDEELFRSVLSGRDPVWTTTQLDLFEAGLLADRWPVGLAAADGTLPRNLPVPFDEALGEEEPASIEFSPDLNEAIVTTVQPFTVATSGGVADTVMLEQTAVFRRGTQRWLLAPPTEAYWGEWRTVETDNLRVDYPERDEDLAIRLAEDLSTAVGRLCAELADNSCDASRLVMRLETDSEALNALLEPVKRQEVLRDAQTNQAIILPAPTLIGRPLNSPALDTAGYQALLHAYLPPVLRVVAAESAGWRCCQQGALFEALFERQLADLGYADWPVDTPDYQKVLADGTRLSDLSYIWRGNNMSTLPEQDQFHLRVAVDFLLKAFPDLTPARMQQLLPVVPNLEQWLGRVLVDSEDKSGNSWVLNSLDQAWWLLAMQGDLDGGEPPMPLPGDSLYLACTAEEGSQRPGPASVYRYMLGDGVWDNMLNVEGFVWMSPLPTPDNLLMQEFVLAEETWQTNVWRNEMRQPLYRTDTGFSISFGESDPSGRYLVSYAWEPEQGQTRAILLDLDTCGGDGCEYAQLSGLPIWSPDGQRAIYSGDQTTLPDNTLINNERIIIFDPGEPFLEQSLSLGVAPSLDSPAPGIAIGAGYAPFWLDNQTFGYIRVVRQGQPGPVVDEEIVVGAVDNFDPQAVLAADDLFEFLPEGQDINRVTLAYVAPHPIDRELIFVVAVDELQKMAFVFSYDLATRVPSLRLQVRYDLNHSFSFSPDGRYLIVTGRDRNSVGPTDNSGILYLHNIAENATTPFAIRLPFFLSSVTYDWTDDSNWLVLAMDDNLIALVAPDYDYAMPITHDYGTCTSVAWLQE